MRSLFICEHVHSVVSRSGMLVRLLISFVFSVIVVGLSGHCLYVSMCIGLGALIETCYFIACGLVSTLHHLLLCSIVLLYTCLTLILQEGRNCGLVEWVDPYWPATLENALTKLWTKLKSARLARLRTI